jgi:apolipoprotein N-acyltransferase
MSRTDGSHHYGLSPLAGVSAGSAAVLFAFGVLALAWHRVAGQVSTGIVMAVYVFIAAAVLAALAAAAHVVLRLYHQAVMQQHERARTAPATEAAPQAVTAARPAAIEPPRVYLNVTEDQLAAILRQQVTDTQLPRDSRGQRPA